MSKFKTNKWIKPGLYTTLDKLSVVLLGFINFFILSRALTKNEFGVWVLFTGLVSVLETLREGFVKQPFIAFMPALEAKGRDEAGTTAFYLNAIYSIAITVMLVLIAHSLEVFWDAAPLALLLKIYAITNLVFIPFSHFEYLQQIELDFKGIFISHFVRSVIPTIFIFVLMFTQRIDLASITVSILAANVVGLAAMIFFGWRYRHKFLKIDKQEVKRMLRFGKYSVGTNAASLSIRNMDSWMLGKMLSTEAVAAYNPAIRISNLVEIPTLTVANLVFPKMAQNFKQNDQVQAYQLYEQSVSLLLAFMLPVCLVMFVFSDWIVYLVAGSQYIESGYLLKITAFYTLFVPFGRQFGILLDAVRRPKFNFYFVVGTALVGTIITWLLILTWGVTGAAYGVLLTYCIRFLAQQWWLYSNLNISTLLIFKAVPVWYLSLLKIFLKR